MKQSKNRKYLEAQIIEEATYFVQKRTTVRGVAKRFQVSKSSVHNHFVKDDLLKAIDYSLYSQVNDLLQTNLKERHIRGGEVTKAKYLHTT